MKQISVDPIAREAIAAAGLLWGEFDRATQAHGLATTGGQVSHTGFAGSTLGGGLGYLMRKHGATCDNLLSVDIVTAGGEMLTASEEVNRDLIWAIRGAGANFGVVRPSDTACIRWVRSLRECCCTRENVQPS